MTAHATMTAQLERSTALARGRRRRGLREAVSAALSWDRTAPRKNARENDKTSCHSNRTSAICSGEAARQARHFPCLSLCSHASADASEEMRGETGRAEQLSPSGTRRAALLPTSPVAVLRRSKVCGCGCGRRMSLFAEFILLPRNERRARPAPPQNFGEALTALKERSKPRRQSDEGSTGVAQSDGRSIR